MASDPYSHKVNPVMTMSLSMHSWIVGCRATPLNVDEHIRPRRRAVTTALGALAPSFLFKRAQPEFCSGCHCVRSTGQSSTCGLAFREGWVGNLEVTTAEYKDTSVKNLEIASGSLVSSRQCHKWRKTLRSVEQQPLGSCPSCQGFASPPFGALGLGASIWD